MSWLFETKIRKSHISGVITAKRWFGNWTVLVDNCEQTGSHTRAVWKRVFRKLKKHPGSKSISHTLMLGLGGGGDTKVLFQNFPHTQLTAVEHDPEMIALAKELALWKPFPSPFIICGDAVKIVPELQGEYELIIVDLFHGNMPSPLVTSSLFLEALNSKLKKNGFLIANVFRKPECFESLKIHFTLVSAWKFELNHIAIFQKKSE